MRGICQTCGRLTNCGRSKCFRHRRFHEDDLLYLTSGQCRDRRKFDPEPIKHWISLTGPVAVVCRAAGIPRRFFYRNHRLQERTVDRYCCALGVHPACLYGEEWWAA